MSLILRPYSAIRAPLRSMVASRLPFSTLQSTDVVPFRGSAGVVAADASPSGSYSTAHSWKLLNLVGDKISWWRFGAVPGTSNLGSGWMFSVLSGSAQPLTMALSIPSTGIVEDDSSDVDEEEQTLADAAIWRISTLKRRRKMMNKHKLRKRRKKLRLKSKK